MDPNLKTLADIILQDFAGQYTVDFIPVTLYEVYGIDGFIDFETKTKTKHGTIFLDRNLNYADMLSTASHELIHMRQFLDGRLVNCPENGMLWEGESYDGAGYRNLPWEIEALHYQKEFDQYIQNMETT